MFLRGTRKRRSWGSSAAARHAGTPNFQWLAQAPRRWRALAKKKKPKFVKMRFDSIGARQLRSALNSASPKGRPVWVAGGGKKVSIHTQHYTHLGATGQIHTLQRDLSLSCTQMAEPLQSLQYGLKRLCGQIDDPPQSWNGVNTICTHQGTAARGTNLEAARPPELDPLSEGTFEDSSC